MSFATKLIISLISISCTIVGSLYTGIMVMEDRRDSKIKEAEGRVYTKIQDNKEERNLLIKAQDEKYSIQFVAINNEISEARRDIRAILRIARKSQVFVEKKEESLYTIQETHKSEGSHL